MGNGLRLLLAARKSRKAGDEDGMERQDHRARTWAQREGHEVIHATTDVKSSQSAPWVRKELRPWMTDAALISLYDAILISDTDRLSRGTDEDFHWIENWAYRNGKRIIVADGPQFPPREGAMGESDRYQWIAQKRAARTYWEAVRDKHADTREVIQANGGAIGLAPFGYKITGAKLHKTFVIDPVTGPLCKEAFKRIKNGHTATSVAIWLSEETGKTWRIKRVTDMIKRRTYLGERDGFTFEAMVSQETWDQANAAMVARSFKHTETGGRRAEHGYSGLIFCECGVSLYRHQSTKNGKPVGTEKYRCGRGRQGNVTEQKCSYGAPSFGPVNDAINRLMSRFTQPERVMVTSGGDYGRQMELQGLQDDMKAAMTRMDMAEVQRLAASVSALQGMESEPIRTYVKDTGRTYGEVWAKGTLGDRRALLERGEYRVLVMHDGESWFVSLEPSGPARESFRMLSVRDFRLGWSEPVAD